MITNATSALLAVDFFVCLSSTVPFRQDNFAIFEAGGVTFPRLIAEAKEGGGLSELVEVTRENRGPEQIAHVVDLFKSLQSEPSAAPSGEGAPKKKRWNRKEGDG